MPAPTDLAYTLPAHAQYHLIRTLNAILPPPPDNLPGAETRRNDSLIARIAALQPANSAENDLAAQFVARNELWMDSVLLSRDPEQPLPMKLKCRAQAASTIRQARSAIRELSRLQAERRQTESDPATCDRGERIEHITTVLLNESLNDPETVMASTAHRVQAIASESTPADLPAAPGGNPIPVSSQAPESHHTETEIPPRQITPPQTPATPSRTNQQPRPTTRSVSPHDPEPRKHKTETDARQSTRADTHAGPPDPTPPQFARRSPPHHPPVPPHTTAPTPSRRSPLPDWLQRPDYEPADWLADVLQEPG